MNQELDLLNGLQAHEFPEGCMHTAKLEGKRGLFYYAILWAIYTSRCVYVYIELSNKSFYMLSDRIAMFPLTGQSSPTLHSELNHVLLLQ